MRSSMSHLGYLKVSCGVILQYCGRDDMLGDMSSHSWEEFGRPSAPTGQM